MREVTFAMQLKRLRTALALTQKALASKIHMKQAYIAQLESGAEANPTLATLQKLAKALEASVGELVGEGPMVREWWRTEEHRSNPPRPLSRAARTAQGSYSTREEAEGAARRLGCDRIARYRQTGGGEVIRQSFPVRTTE